MYSDGITYLAKPPRVFRWKHLFVELGRLPRRISLVVMRRSILVVCWLSILRILGASVEAELLAATFLPIFQHSWQQHASHFKRHRQGPVSFSSAC